MELEFTHCVFSIGDRDAVEKPGIITISGNTVKVDDFVVIVQDSDVQAVLGKFIQDRLKSTNLIP